MAVKFVGRGGDVKDSRWVLFDAYTLMAGRAYDRELAALSLSSGGFPLIGSQLHADAVAAPHPLLR